MTFTMPRLTAAAIALMIAAPAAAQDAPGPDTVVATVNGQDITLGHMRVVRENLPQDYDGLPAATLFQGILDQLVRQEVVAQDDNAEETPRVRYSVENQRRTLLASTVLEEVAADAVTDAAVQAAYDAQFADEGGGTEYNASHILVETLEEAAELAEEAAAGADFAALAREHSTGPSGPNGGSLGWFGDGMMVEPFQAAVAEMDPGDVSAPVQTQFGWHVIKLNDTRIQEAPPLEQVRGQIEQRLQAEAVNAYVDAQVAGAEVSRVDGLAAELVNDPDLFSAD